MKQHLRVFNNNEEMNKDFQAYAANADKCKIRNMTAVKGVTKTYWMICNDEKEIRQRIAGMQLNRISCDIRTPQREMMYMFTRLRSPEYPVEPMQVFYKDMWGGF
jgi:hypothetical protein